MGDASRERVALGRALRKKRRELDLSQEAVATRGDVHVNLVGRLERGLNVETETFLRTLRGLNVGLEEVGRLYDAERARPEPTRR
jgi:transcriptional regulator with XRE-family HTH domain